MTRTDPAAFTRDVSRMVAANDRRRGLRAVVRGLRARVGRRPVRVPSSSRVPVQRQARVR